MAIRRKSCAGAVAALVLLTGVACSGDDGQPQPAPTPAPTYPSPAAVTGSVLVHDPAVVKRPDGSYLLAYTGNNIPMKTSADRTEFTETDKAAFPDGAPWTAPYTNGSSTLWAPDLSYQNGRYWLYYSASTFGSNHSAIFLATSTSGNPGTWKNQGLVVESNKPDNFNAIDPNLYVDPSGRWWLTFGSFWSGIQLVELDPKTGKRLDTTIRTVASRGGDAIEAPFLIRRGQYYYLFVSFDKCCQGPSSTYRIMVGRSTDPTGPYVDRNGTAMTDGGGTEILAGHDDIRGPGHQAVLTDTDGDVLFYHHYAGNGSAMLGVNQLAYDSAGWPYVR